jgi:hypothetical protein
MQEAKQRMASIGYSKTLVYLLGVLIEPGLPFDVLMIHFDDQIVIS